MTTGNNDFGGLKLRPLTQSDINILFAWKNNPSTRENSGNTEEVPWPVHETWFYEMLLTCPEDKILRIAEKNGVPVGLIRMHTLGNDRSELRFTVAPECRNHGIGTNMVMFFIDEYVPVSCELLLYIKEGNVAAMKIAKKLYLFELLQECPGKARIAS